MSTLRKSGPRPTGNLGRRTAEQTLNPPRLAWPALLPPLLLALLALLAAVLAHALRPSVSVDIGDYYDRVYVEGFHARETAPVFPMNRYPWPAGSNELVVPAYNPHLNLGILHLEPAMAGSDWGIALVYANGRQINRISYDEDEPGVLAFALSLPEERGPLTIELRKAPEPDAGPVQVKIAGLTTATPQTYRWTTEEGRIDLPGIGRGAWKLTLGATLAHPDGSPVNTQLLVNTTPLASLPDQPERRRYHLLVPPDLTGSGNLELRVQAETFSDPRSLGALIELVEVTPISTTPLRPPWILLGGLLGLALGSYASLARVRVPRWLAAAVAMLFVLSASWALVNYHGLMGFYLPRLALLALGTLALVLALEPLLSWAFARAGVPLSGELRNGLLLLFVAGLWMKAGAMVWPYFVGIDVSWHMERVRWVLDGRLAEMYRPGGFSESVMPASEWGNERPIIPYSPFFHIFGTIFTLSPIPMVLTAHLFSALVDNSRVFLIAMIARKSGLSSRTALLSAALYSVTPVTFLLHSWGNVPTTFGMWWSLLALTFIIAAYLRLDRRWPFIILTLILTTAFLMYTVSGVFTGVVLVLLVPSLLIWNRSEGRRPIWAVFWATVASSGLALLIYYGQYIPPMIERTIPYFSQTIRYGQDVVGIAEESFGEYIVKYPTRMDYSGRPLYYGILIPLLFFPLGLFLQRSRRLGALMISWFMLAVLFVLLGLRVPMVDKQLFYIVPLLALAGGIVFAGLWRRGASGRLVTVVWYLFTLIAALDLWIYRVANVQQ